MKFYEAIEFVKKNPTKTVIENNPNKAALVAIRNWMPMSGLQMATYDPKHDNFADWTEIILSTELTNMNFIVYMRKFSLAEHGVKHKNAKEKIFKESLVKECYDEIVRKIEEDIKTQFANSTTFINKRDTMRIIKETFGDLE